MTDIRLIAAIGRSGQLGMNGRLPWANRDDLQWFKQQTSGGIVVMGRRTADQVPDLDIERTGRSTIVWGGRTPPERVIADLKSVIRIERTPDRIIWIAGGAYTYLAFMPFVRRAVVTLIDYDGPADTFMPPLWHSSPHQQENQR